MPALWGRRSVWLITSLAKHREIILYLSRLGKRVLRIRQGRAARRQIAAGSEPFRRLPEEAFSCRGDGRGSPFAHCPAAEDSSQSIRFALERRISDISIKNVIFRKYRHLRSWTLPPFSGVLDRRSSLPASQGGIARRLRTAVSWK